MSKATHTPGHERQVFGSAANLAQAIWDNLISHNAKPESQHFCVTLLTNAIQDYTAEVQADLLEACKDSGVESAITQMGEIEDRCVRSRLEGKRARISITADEWSTLRDTLKSFDEVRRAALTKATGDSDE